MDFINEFALVAVTLESCNGKLKLNFVAPEIGAEKNNAALLLTV